jgi:hypothetical protein
MNIAKDTRPSGLIFDVLQIIVQTWQGRVKQTNRMLTVPFANLYSWLNECMSGYPHHVHKFRKINQTLDGSALGCGGEKTSLCRGKHQPILMYSKLLMQEQGASVDHDAMADLARYRTDYCGNSNTEGLHQPLQWILNVTSHCLNFGLWTKWGLARDAPCPERQASRSGSSKANSQKRSFETATNHN